MIRLFHDAWMYEKRCEGQTSKSADIEAPHILWMFVREVISSIIITQVAMKVWSQEEECKVSLSAPMN